MRIQRQRQPNRFAPLLKILLSVVVIVGVSFCVAWVWQNTEQQSSEPTPPPASESLSEAVPETVSEADPQDDSEDQSAESLPDEPDTSDIDGMDDEPPPEEKIIFDGAVPESEPVSGSYFDDAIFIGDSISTGIPLYHVADNAAVVAMTGVGPMNVSTRKCIDIGGDERVTVLEAAKTYGERGKVYIMMGGNGLDSEKTAFIEAYRGFLGDVKELYPDTVIYLQSITPVVEGYVNEVNPNFNNDVIDEYNLEIMSLAKQEGVYYLDVASALKDENGALPKDASPYDGLHFTPEYYVKWFDYLKTHTVSPEVNK